VFTIGPYAFTREDAERTVLHATEILQLFADRRDAHVIVHLEPKLTGDLAADLEAVWASWMAAGPALRAAGQLPSTATGTVAQLNTSNGGVPKTPVDRIDIGWRGVVGDRQASRRHHGRPWQALCLWSTEVIDAFRAGGHPLAPGYAGENITITGLVWDDIRPGVRLLVGDVLCEVTAYALPCFQNRAFFKDDNFRAMHHESGPVSRVYATVLQPGSVRAGDPAVLEPS
jgi:MOSC domain-containing protein YiiM